MKISREENFQDDDNREPSVDYQQFLDYCLDVEDDPGCFDNLQKFLTDIRPDMNWKAMVDECKRIGGTRGFDVLKREVTRYFRDNPYP